MKGKDKTHTKFLWFVTKMLNRNELLGLKSEYVFNYGFLPSWSEIDKRT